MYLNFKYFNSIINSVQDYSILSKTFFLTAYELNEKNPIKTIIPIS